MTAEWLGMGDDALLCSYSRCDMQRGLAEGARSCLWSVFLLPTSRTRGEHGCILVW